MGNRPGSIKRTLLRSLIGLFLIGLFLLPGLRGARAGSIVDTWLADPSKVQQQRIASKKPVFCYIYNTRAQNCKLMEDTVFPHQEVSILLNDFLLVGLNADLNQELVKRFQLVRLPTIILLDSQGKEVDRAVGYKDPKALARYLDGVLKLEKQYQSKEATSPYKFGAADILSQMPNTRAVNLSIQAANAKKVFLVGDFNDWRTEAAPMIGTGTGNWAITVYLPDGSFEYKYLVDGDKWLQDPRNPYSKPDPYGGFNSVLSVGTVKSSPIIQGKRVTFILYETDAKTAAVAGTFNNWQPQALFRNPKDRGMWGMYFDNIPSGSYQYKYIIDEEWTLDPENFTPQGTNEGYTNSSFVIP